MIQKLVHLVFRKCLQDFGESLDMPTELEQEHALIGQDNLLLMKMEIYMSLTKAIIVSLYAGKGTEAGYKDGTPDRARFRDPEAVVFLSDGAMYVADRNNHCIRRVVVE